MEETKPAPEAMLRCARAALLLASLRRPRAPTLTQDRRRTSYSSSGAAAAELARLRSEGLLRSAEIAAARREAAAHARVAGSELLLVLAVAPAVLLLLLLGLL
ncbi:hypothetical protein Zm00014a_003546 [Zea mays]|uniref:Uncharacterized protein n=1 Tax=Zea mays TaxID=4577 RepID=A0A3L6G0I1_MAIZE|nr:hypothetical protein Zm00014a_003546 [Zea mays]